MKNYFLTDLEINHFRFTGYLKIKNKLPDKLVDQVKKKVVEDFKNPSVPFRLDKDNNVCRLDNLFNRNTIYKKVAKSNLILDPIQSLVGPNIELLFNRHNHVTLNKYTRFELHRDILQWTKSLITVIIYLEESTVENGCTHIIPYSQFLSYKGKPNNGGTWLDERSAYKDLINQAIPVPIPKGGILLIDSLAFHSVGENVSDKSRISIALGYRGIDELVNTENKYSAIVRGENIYRGNKFFSS